MVASVVLPLPQLGNGGYFPRLLLLLRSLWLQLLQFAPRELLSCYSWVDYGPSNNLPFTHVVAARLVGDEPAVFDQSFGRVDRALSIPDEVGSVDTDISRADGGLGPALEEGEQQLRRLRLLCFLGL